MKKETLSSWLFGFICAFGAATATAVEAPSGSLRPVQVKKSHGFCQFVIQSKSRFWRFWTPGKKEQDALEEFHVGYDLEVIRPMGVNPSFLVRDRNGIDFVLRFPTSEHDFRKELFVSELYELFPNNLAVSSKALSTNDSLLLLHDLALKEHMDGGELKRIARLIENGRQRATISIFVPWADGSGLTKSIRVEKGLAWEQDTDDSVELFLNAPDTVQQQVANHWAVTSVLNVRDFHSGNWLSDGAHVAALDFGWTGREELANDSAIPLEGLQSPMNSERSTSDRFNQVLAAQVDDSTLKQIEALGREELMEAAKASSYPLTETELQVILQRAQALRAYRNESRR